MATDDSWNPVANLIWSLAQVMRGDSRLRSHEFKSRHRILDGLLSNFWLNLNSRSVVLRATAQPTVQQLQSLFTYQLYLNTKNFQPIWYISKYKIVLNCLPTVETLFWRFWMKFSAIDKLHLTQIWRFKSFTVGPPLQLYF